MAETLTGSEVRDGTEHAKVADGEAAALELLGLELVVSCALGQLLGAVGDGGESSAADVENDGCDQTSWRSDGHGNVSLMVPGELWFYQLSAEEGQGKKKLEHTV